MFKQDIKREEPSTGEIGWENSMLYRSKDFGKYAPDDLLTTKGYGIYSKMMRDDQVKPCLLFKQDAVVSRDWYFDIDDENEQHVEISDVFSAIVQQMDGSFKDKLKGVLSGLKYGFSITEKIYQPIDIDGKTWWGVKDLKLRPFHSFDGGFETDDHGNIISIKQKQGTEYKKIPLDKIIHFVHQPDIDTHYGESDLRACYRAWWSKDIDIKLWNIYLERMASGFIWAKTTGALSPTQKTNLQNFLNNISGKTTARMPASVDLNVENPTSTDAFEKALIAHDKAIAKALLVPNLLGLSEQGSTGSYSQSQTQLDAFIWVLDEIAGRLQECLNEQLFRELAWWNFGTEDFPWFKWEPISDDKKAELAKTWNELVKGGSVTKTDADEGYIRNLLGFPEKPEDEEVDETPPENAPTEMPEQEGWIDAQPEPERSFIKQQFADKPWLKRVNFAQIEATLDKQDEAFIDEMADILANVRFKIEKDIAKVAGQRSFGHVKPKEVMTIKMTQGDVSKMRKVIRDNLTQTLNAGYDIASKELPKRKYRILMGMDKTQTERYLSSKALKQSVYYEQEVFTAVQRVLENAIKYDKTLRTTINDMSNDTGIKTLMPEYETVTIKGKPVTRAINKPARIENIARTLTADAINQARDSLFKSPELRGFVQAYEYSAMLDDRTTDICEHLHGKILRDFGTYMPPNHFQCRSVLAPVTLVDDWDGKESPKPRVEPQSGFK